MRVLCLYLLAFLVFPPDLPAQSPEWGAFVQRIDASAMRGKKFRLQAAVKVQTIDSTAQGHLWVRVDKPEGKTGFFYNMMDKPFVWLNGRFTR